MERHLSFTRLLDFSWSSLKQSTLGPKSGVSMHPRHPSVTPHVLSLHWHILSPIPSEYREYNSSLVQGSQSNVHPSPGSLPRPPDSLSASAPHLCLNITLSEKTSEHLFKKITPSFMIASPALILLDHSKWTCGCVSSLMATQECRAPGQGAWLFCAWLLCRDLESVSTRYYTVCPSSSTCLIFRNSER